MEAGGGSTKTADGEGGAEAMATGVLYSAGDPGDGVQLLGYSTCGAA